MAKTYSLKAAQGLLDQAIADFKHALDRRMQIAQDIRKEFLYDKATSDWYWHDRGDNASLEAIGNPHKTFWDALYDAVEPYLEKSDG